MTDHHPVDVTGCSSGFGFPLMRWLLMGDVISAKMTLVYPATRSSSASDSDEGTIWSTTVEKDIVPTLLEDPE